MGTIIRCKFKGRPLTGKWHCKDKGGKRWKAEGVKAKGRRMWPTLLLTDGRVELYAQTGCTLKDMSDRLIGGKLKKGRKLLVCD